MARQVSTPPEQQQKHISQPLPEQRQRVSGTGIITLLVLIGLLLLLFTGLFIRNLSQVIRPGVHSKGTQQASVTALAQDPSDVSPLAIPGDVAVPALSVPADRYVVYEQDNKVFVLSTQGGQATQVATPGYIYNRAIQPVVTSSGQLLYSGNGLWLTDIFDGASTQVATLDADQVITSMALSSDGTTVAWSTEPEDGDGSINIYAGPLAQTTLVYQHAASDCPCFRVFSFMNGSGQQGDTTLLLADDRGDHHLVQYGLWSYNLTLAPSQDPLPLLDANPSQGPLALAPHGTTLLYSSYEGIVPAPTDASVPDDAGTQSYANSLYLATASGSPLALGPAQVALSEQHDLTNNAAYRWVTTPLFSPDGHSVFYVEFSNDTQDPYNRHSAIYTVQVSGVGTHLKVSKPQLLASATTRFLELGSWVNDHTLTIFADGTLYFLDSHTGATTRLISTRNYARVVAVVGQGLP